MTLPAKLSEKLIILLVPMLLISGCKRTHDEERIKLIADAKAFCEHRGGVQELTVHEVSSMPDYALGWCNDLTPISLPKNSKDIFVKGKQVSE